MGGQGQVHCRRTGTSALWEDSNKCIVGGEGQVLYNRSFLSTIDSNPEMRAYPL